MKPIWPFWLLVALVLTWLAYLNSSLRNSVSAAEATIHKFIDPLGTLPLPFECDSEPAIIALTDRNISQIYCRGVGGTLHVWSRDKR
jgi:hypothetical protein